MSPSGEKWFVEQFHLRSPVEEFEEFSQLEIRRLRAENVGFNDATHREAIDLVLGCLRPNKTGGKR